ncbi:5-oxoprolinase subunit PxpB [Flavobacteriaceae bacterium 3-367]|uniref:5-oxoprolinase subunit PxpB n=1 Tax=Eudoraea algarum TaxID=3417568 RepID=UPI0032701F5B
MSTYTISIKPFGAHAVIVEWPMEVEEAILYDILQYLQHLKAHCLAQEDWELIPAYNSLTFVHRETPIDFENFSQHLKEWYANKGETQDVPRFLWRLPVCYDKAFGIDLSEVSDRLGKSISEIITLHTQHTYTVYGIGFLPGFMYLGGLPQSLEVARRTTPRLLVEKGSVGLASKQTGIYPQDSPGGWNIIGNCPIPMFNINKDDPCFVSVGDKIQFYAISRAEYDLHKIEGEVGIFQLEKRLVDA